MIYRIDGPADVAEVYGDALRVVNGGGFVELIDDTVPLPPHAFYMLGVEPAP